jgi:hypothetical protein
MAERAKVLDKSTNDARTEVTIKFLESGEILNVKVGELNTDMQARLICHGLEQKLGDAAAGKSGDEAFEAVMAVYERLIAGDWAKAREAAGPRPSMVAQAVINAKVAAGQTVDEKATLAKYTGADSAEARKMALANPAVRAAYEALRLEAAQKRAAEAQAKAGGADVSSL